MWEKGDISWGYHGHTVIMGIYLGMLMELNGSDIMGMESNLALMETDGLYDDICGKFMGFKGDMNGIFMGLCSLNLY